MENRYCGACRGERGCAGCKKAAKNARYSGLTGFLGEKEHPAKESVDTACYYLAADVGTTTLAFVCTDGKGQVLASYGCVNPQRKIAADVIGRVDYACRQGRKELKEQIREALGQGFLFVLQSAEEKYGTACTVRAGIAGNTVMLHLLLDYPVEGLAKAPFTPYRTEGLRQTGSELFGRKGEGKEGGAPKENDTAFEGGAPEENGTDFGDSEAYRRLCGSEVVVLPCFSAFVGADLFAGAYFLDFFRKGQNKTMLLADFGTNGELLLLHNGVIYATAAAMGTAFEGGRFSYAADLFRLAARARKEGMADAYGLLSEPYFSEGFEGLFQEDIREFQLAKGAVRAGIELLCEEAGIAPAAVEEVFLAGGLGHFCAEEDLLVCGLLPREFAGKLTMAGNSCIGGIVKYLVNGETMCSCTGKVMNLAENPKFEEVYYSYMNFEDI